MPAGSDRKNPNDTSHDSGNAERYSRQFLRILRRGIILASIAFVYTRQLVREGPETLDGSGADQTKGATFYSIGIFCKAITEKGIPPHLHT